MSQEEPENFARITLASGEDVELSADNTYLYRHIGNLTMYDHVFVVLPEETGIYFWQHNEAYHTLAALAVENECTMHLNIREVSTTDMKYYIEHQLKDLGDTLPEEWDE